MNPVSTHALITGINGNNDYKRWSEELIGTINVTVTDTDKPNMGYFDRITIQKEYSYFSENLPVRTDGENFSYLLLISRYPYTAYMCLMVLRCL